MKLINSKNQNDENIENFGLNKELTIKNVLKKVTFGSKNKTQISEIKKDIDCKETQEKQMSKKSILENLKEGIDSLFVNLSESETVLEEKNEEKVEVEATDKEVEAEIESEETQEKTVEEGAEEEVQEENSSEESDETEEQIEEENVVSETSKGESLEKNEEKPEPEVEKEAKNEIKNVVKSSPEVDELTMVKAKAKALEEQIAEMNKAKQEELVKAQKSELLTKAKKELAFSGGTPEENAEKLFDIKSALGEEKSELFDFVIDSLKKQSQKVEKELDASGEDVSEEDLGNMDSANARLDKLAEEIAKRDNISEAEAFRKACVENESLVEEARKENRK